MIKYANSLSRWKFQYLTLHPLPSIEFKWRVRILLKTAYLQEQAPFLCNVVFEEDAARLETSNNLKGKIWRNFRQRESLLSLPCISMNLISFHTEGLNCIHWFSLVYYDNAFFRRLWLVYNALGWGLCLWCGGAIHNLR